MKQSLVATACATLILGACLGGSLASAQDSQRNLPPKSLRQQPAQTATGGPAPAAPVGHRQPRAGEVPETGVNDPDRIDPQDRELDRMIKNICKGC